MKKEKDESIDVDAIRAMNLRERMLNIQFEMETVGKNLNIGKGQNAYKGVSERDVIDAVKKLEKKYRVFSYPTKRIEIDHDYKDYTDNYGNPKRNTYLRLKTYYRFENLDNPDEYIETETFAHGFDNSDKAFGKAETYSDKYALMKMYKISTGDDPEEVSARETEQENARRKTSQNTPKTVSINKTSNDTPKVQTEAKPPETAQIPAPVYVGSSDHVKLSALNKRIRDESLNKLAEVFSCTLEMAIKAFEKKTQRRVADIDDSSIVWFNNQIELIIKSKEGESHV